jgi:GTPase KRas protein
MGNHPPKPMADGFPLTHNLTVVLVGNKCDLASDRQVARDVGAALAKSCVPGWYCCSLQSTNSIIALFFMLCRWGCSFFEASAKTRQNVDEGFFTLVRKIRELEKGPSAAPVKTKPKKSGGCLLF